MLIATFLLMPSCLGLASHLVDSSTISTIEGHLLLNLAFARYGTHLSPLKAWT